MEGQPSGLSARFEVPRRINPKINVAIAFLLAIGLGVSMVLIVMGSRNSKSGSGSNSHSETSTTDDPRAAKTTRSTLPANDGTLVSLSTISGLTFPSDVSDFRSAENPNREQLDILFSTSASAIEAFVNGSGLPALTTGERLIIHGSPLWTLNDESGRQVASTEDSWRGVHRSVEVLTTPEEPSGMAEVRVSLSAGPP